MASHVSTLLPLLDQSLAALRAAVDALPADVRARKPSPDRWSAAEVLEHLALVNARFTKLVSDAIAAAGETGAAPGLGDPLDPTLRGRIADRTEKRQAPDVSTPTGRVDVDAAWSAMERAHRDFRTLLEGLDGRALGHVRAPHPRWGTLTICQYAELFAGHEQRHAAQIHELNAEVA